MRFCVLGPVGVVAGEGSARFRQAEALAAYRSLHQRLRDELSIEPSPAAQALHKRILRQDPDLAPPPRAAGPSRPASASPTALIRRADEVRSVASLVVEAPLVMLTGPGVPRTGPRTERRQPASTAPTRPRAHSAAIAGRWGCGQVAPA
jgi:hypothetical protein